MSFEGYHQLICKKGHYFAKDVYNSPIENFECPTCKDKLAWWNIVDVTNGSFEGKERIDGYIELKIKTKAKLCACDKCNNVHIVEDATYQIPKKGGHKVSKGD
jgi:uncharacterized protein YlaI